MLEIRILIHRMVFLGEIGTMEHESGLDIRTSRRLVEITVAPGLTVGYQLGTVPTCRGK